MTVPGAEQDVDVDHLVEVMLHLLSSPSPSGRTDHVVQHVGDRLSEAGLEPYLTRRGAVRVILGDSDAPGSHRSVIAHADTIGAMVSGFTPTGRLQLVPVGSHSARFAEGARVTLFTDQIEVTYSGTVLPLKASGHRYGPEIDTQGVGWDQVELRLDEVVSSPQDIADLGINIGDHVAFDAQPVVTKSGFVVSRHLDDKAGLAAIITAAKDLAKIQDQLPAPVHVLVTISEEVGHGASHGIDANVAEMVSVDNAVVAPGQHSSEHAVTVAMQDMHGPFDYHLTRHLLDLCDAGGIDHRRDVFHYYRSDVAAALESGSLSRAALIGAGIDASHGHERTHLDALVAVVRLLRAYALSPLTFDDWGWDPDPEGPLEGFPSYDVQPAPEQPDMRDERADDGSDAPSGEG